MIDGILTHGTHTGAGTLAFAIRSGVNLALLMARLNRVPKYVSTHQVRTSADSTELQETPYLLNTACYPWFRLVPFCCHAW